MNLMQFLSGLARVSSQQRAQGNHSKANALACIVFGILLLPFPIIGLPLLIYGLIKLFK